MPRTFSLSAVLALRQQKEIAEERALAAIAAQVEHLRAGLSRVDRQIAQLQVTRVAEMRILRIAADHQAFFARQRTLHEARTELRAQLEAMEKRRLDQQVRYLGARSGREMLTEMRHQQRTAWAAELSAREQKRMDDLFIARRPRQ